MSDLELFANVDHVALWQAAGDHWAARLHVVPDHVMRGRSIGSAAADRTATLRRTLFPRPDPDKDTAA
jgi:hypothetical protein